MSLQIKNYTIKCWRCGADLGNNPESADFEKHLNDTGERHNEFRIVANYQTPQPIPPKVAGTNPNPTITSGLSDAENQELNTLVNLQRQGVNLPLETTSRIAELNNKLLGARQTSNLPNSSGGV